MRTIAIIGSGQAGLLLAYMLTKSGYEVTLFNNRTAEQVLKGRILSSQGMFDTALQLERKWGLNFWDNQCPWNLSFSTTLYMANSFKQNISWKGLTQQPFQAIDQRLKFSVWLQEYENIGGKLVIEAINLAKLDSIAAKTELTIVAGGKSEISQLFSRNDQRSIFTNPQRSLACMYVKGMLPVTKNPGAHAGIISGIGEYFTMPGLTLTGQCEMMLFEGIPGQAFDCWDNITSPKEQLSKGIALLKEYLPWEAERCENIQLTDDQATLLGHCVPIIRHPIAIMPCGKAILGMADTVVLNDPIAGQGANNAAKCADIYFNSILHCGNNAFDEQWMLTTFERFWQKIAKPATQLSTMLLSPAPPHMLTLLTAAAKTPLVANKLANGFDSPITLFDWITDPILTNNMIEQLENEQNKSY